MASAAGSLTDVPVRPDDRLRDWFTAYINKIEDMDKQRLNYFYWWIPDEMSREYGDLRSVLREVEVDKVWMILMSVTGSQSSVDMLGRRKRRDALYESINDRHDDIAKTIIEYLTPDQIFSVLTTAG